MWINHRKELYFVFINLWWYAGVSYQCLVISLLEFANLSSFEESGLISQFYLFITVTSVTEVKTALIKSTLKKEPKVRKESTKGAAVLYYLN